MLAHLRQKLDNSGLGIKFLFVDVRSLAGYLGVEEFSVLIFDFLCFHKGWFTILLL